LSAGFRRSKLFKREGAEVEKERISLEIDLPGNIAVVEY
jgi:hypothetical protein